MVCTWWPWPKPFASGQLSVCQRDSVRHEWVACFTKPSLGSLVLRCLTWYYASFRYYALTLSSILILTNWRKRLQENTFFKVKLLRMSNFIFFHSVFYAICILKSFNSHISVIVYNFFEFGTISEWCIREWVQSPFYQSNAHLRDSCRLELSPLCRALVFLYVILLSAILS